jgi:hypothetical protein
MLLKIPLSSRDIKMSNSKPVMWLTQISPGMKLIQMSDFSASHSLFVDLLLFYCWRGNRDYELSRNSWTPEKDHRPMVYGSSSAVLLDDQNREAITDLVKMGTYG